MSSNPNPDRFANFVDPSLLGLDLSIPQLTRQSRQSRSQQRSPRSPRSPSPIDQKKVDSDLDREPLQRVHNQVVNHDTMLIKAFRDYTNTDGDRKSRERFIFQRILIESLHKVKRSNALKSKTLRILRTYVGFELSKSLRYSKTHQLGMNKFLTFLVALKNHEKLKPIGSIRFNASELYSIQSEHDLGLITCKKSKKKFCYLYYNKSNVVRILRRLHKKENKFLKANIKKLDPKMAVILYITSNLTKYGKIFYHRRLTFKKFMMLKNRESVLKDMGMLHGHRNRLNRLLDGVF